MRKFHPHKHGVLAGCARFRSKSINILEHHRVHTQSIERAKHVFHVTYVCSVKFVNAESYVIARCLRGSRLELAIVHIIRESKLQVSHRKHMRRRLAGYKYLSRGMRDIIIG